MCVFEHLLVEPMRKYGKSYAPREWDSMKEKIVIRRERE